MKVDGLAKLFGLEWSRLDLIPFESIRFDWIIQIRLVDTWIDLDG